MFNFYMPTKIHSGIGCVKNNADAFGLGKKCIIVSGKNSARASGALADICEVLDQNGTQYLHFDKISENPAISDCFEGGRLAAEFGAEFVIGIGGGSALDACKAVSAYAANRQLSEMEDIFDASKLTNNSLPIIAVPTTAGTGSEVNPYAVLTLQGGVKKQTFNNPMSYPKHAFLDVRYTMSLSPRYTLSTALDAFCHAVESFLSPKSTDASELFALYAARAIWRNLNEIYIGGDVDVQLKQELLDASCAAGIAINTTGTGFPHPMGYNLTLLHGVPHGMACAAFTGEYLSYNEMANPQRCRILYDYIGTDGETLKHEIPLMSCVDMKFDDAEIEKFIELTGKAKNYTNSFYKINTDEIRAIYKKLFQ
ncbi:MAG: iron-containing alcohol dehydrogenase [Ruminococcaceae bacterium]|nr:iron-containing alcohol dehydrogenase [Oscillospiraceae bacterium]